MSETTDWRSDPGYSEGFFDAQDGEPLFPDAVEPYRAGWEAYWRCRDILAGAGFKKDGDKMSITIRAHS